MNDFDELIRSAKPKVNDGSAGRVIELVAHGFARPAVPTPWLRIAAALLLACGTGFAVSAWFAAPGAESAELAAVQRQIEDIDRRLTRADASLSAPQITEFDHRLEQAIARSVDEVSVARSKARRERQREAHLAYARKEYEKSVEKALVKLKKDYDLSPTKEAELRAVFTEHGTQVQQLISRNYRGKTRSLHGEFATIKRATDARVQSVLSEVPLNMPGGDLAEWGPNPDYESLSDYESIQRWREEAQQPG